MAQLLAQSDGQLARLRLGQESTRLGSLSVQRSGMGFVEVGALAARAGGRKPRRTFMPNLPCIVGVKLAGAT
jgi:hypothetical protein